MTLYHSHTHVWACDRDLFIICMILARAILHNVNFDPPCFRQWHLRKFWNLLPGNEH